MISKEYTVLESAIIKMSQYTSALEELCALADGVDDDWWFKEGLAEDDQDKLGLKLKLILSKYRADTAEIDEEIFDENDFFFEEVD